MADPIDPQVALVLLRSLPGEARIVREIVGSTMAGGLALPGFMVQFEGGMEISYRDGGWALSVNPQRRDEWKTSGPIAMRDAQRTY